jgi:hypothetical protein
MVENKIKKQIKTQLKEMKEENNVLGYNVLKFDVISLNSVLKYAWTGKILPDEHKKYNVNP